MDVHDIQTIFGYNYWANRRILAASKNLSLEQFLASNAHSYGSLRGTLVHTLDAERAWRLLIQQQTLAGFGEIVEADIPNIDALEQRWDEEERTMRDYLAGLTDADIINHIHYTADTGQKRERPLWHCLFHLVNHGTQHRSEAAAILTEYGASPDDLDFTAFLNERAV